MIEKEPKKLTYRSLIVLLLVGIFVCMPRLAGAKKMELRELQFNYNDQIVRFPSGAISFADKVVSFTRGGPYSKSYGTPNNATHKPDGSFVSLGCYGQLILKFTDNVLVDRVGVDLFLFQGGKIPELVKLEVSSDGNKWIPLGGKAVSFKTAIDIAPYVPPKTTIRFVKITDGGQPKSCNNKSSGADIDAVGAISSGIVVAGALFFDHDKSDLNGSEKIQAAKIISLIKRFNISRIEVAGHTDNKGSHGYNLKLSQQRADSIVNQLDKIPELKGVEKSAIGLGEEIAEYDNSTEEGRRQNRRVEIILFFD